MIASWRWWSGLMSKPIRKRRIERGEVMGDVMLNGVLNMPLPEHPEDCDIVTWVQFKAASRQAADRIEELESKLKVCMIALTQIAYRREHRDAFPRTALEALLKLEGE